MSDFSPHANLEDVAERTAALTNLLATRRGDIQLAERELTRVREYLDLSDAIGDALDKLSEKMFGQIADLLEKHVSQALREVLELPLQLKVERNYLRGRATISFHIERDGNREDIMRGQGGSVTNVLSVALRFFALQTLDPKIHRRFIVLDEQDCWLRPDLVPSLVRIIYGAGRALGFQVLLISHHDVSAFSQYADKIYKLEGTDQGVAVTELYKDEWKG